MLHERRRSKISRPRRRGKFYGYIWTAVASLSAILVIFALFGDLEMQDTYPLLSESIAQLTNGASTNPSRNETLVVVLGSLRGGEKTWQSLYREVLDSNAADLALVVGAVPVGKKTSSMYVRAKFVWEFPEYDDWGQAIDLMGQSEDQPITWRDLARNNTDRSAIFGGAKESPKGSGAINYMARWLLTQKLQQLGLLQHYRRFVITRSDHYYLCGTNFNRLDSKYIWMPEGEDYQGYQDRFFICNSDTVLKALDILPPLVKHPQKYMVSLDWSQTHPEVLTKYRWDEEGLSPLVKRFPRTMFLAATPQDTSRWTKPRAWFLNEDMKGIGIKYFSEFELCNQTCAVVSAKLSLLHVPGFATWGLERELARLKVVKRFFFQFSPQIKFLVLDDISKMTKSEIHTLLEHKLEEVWDQFNASQEQLRTYLALVSD